jgi:hypothetical protein
VRLTFYLPFFADFYSQEKRRTTASLELKPMVHIGRYLL